jgi:hypothetical protein
MTCPSAMEADRLTTAGPASLSLPEAVRASIGGGFSMSRERKRLTVEFSKRLADKLERLAEKQDTTKTEVLRRAILLLELAEAEWAKGHRLTISDADDRVLKEIVA